MNKIDEIRKKKNLSYGDIAKESGITPTYVFLLSKGKRDNPSLEVMQNIANALGERVEKVFSFNVAKSSI